MLNKLSVLMLCSTKASSDSDCNREILKTLQIVKSIANSSNTSVRLVSELYDESSSGIESIAQETSIPLHIIIHGHERDVGSLSIAAERIVWLGNEIGNAQSTDAASISRDFLLAQSDMLVVNWDDNSSIDHDRIVAYIIAAIQLMMPVVWITSTGSVRLLERQKLSNAKLALLKLSQLSSNEIQKCFGPSVTAEANLISLLENEIGSIVNPNKLTNDRSLTCRTTCYTKEEPLEINSLAGRLYELFILIALGHFFKLNEVRKKLFSPRRLTAYFGKADWSLDQPFLKTITIDKSFAVADIQANLAAGRHRDTTCTLFFSSAFAVFSAVAGAIGMWPGGHSSLWPITELLLISIIISLFFIAKKNQWHRRWISHRFIAEQLRYTRMCFPLLVTPKPLLQPAWQAKNGQLHLANAEVWLLRRIMSNEGLPTTNNHCYVASNIERVDLIANYLRSVTEDQRDYHHKNHHKFESIEHNLHSISTLLFALTAVAVLLHFVIHSEWLLIFTAGFPAVAAALHGLATTLEVNRISSQSQLTESRLNECISELDELLLSKSSSYFSNWTKLRSIALEASSVMSEENSQWQQLLSQNETALPA